MADDFHRPAFFGGDEFEAFAGGEDPAAVMRAAHESAHALLTRAQDSDDPGRRRPAGRLHRRARHRRARRAVGAVGGAQPAGRALAHLPGAGDDPAGSGGRRAALPARHRGAAHDRPGRRRARRPPPGRTRSPSWPIASCAGCSRATSPSRSSAPPRSAGSRRRGRPASPTIRMPPAPSVRANSPRAHSG